MGIARGGNVWLFRGAAGLLSGLGLLLGPAEVVHAGGGSAPAASAQAASSAAPAPSPSAAPVAAPVVRMEDVALRLGLQRRDTDLLGGRTVYQGGGNVVVLAPGLRQALVNGKGVALGRPVGCNQGDLIVPLDAVGALERALGGARPVVVAAPAPPPATTPAAAPRVERLAPPSRVAPGSAGIVVIDAGHGGKFTGARGARGLYEKDVNLAITLLLRERLEARGFKVVLTRDDDQPLNATLNADLDARAEMANRVRADLFVSIHANHADARDVRGFEVYYHAPSEGSAALARHVHQRMKARVDDTDRGVKTARFRVLRLARMPAVLIETGFLSNAVSERDLGDDAYQQAIADAITEGIVGFRAR